MILLPKYVVLAGVLVILVGNSADAGITEGLSAVLATYSDDGSYGKDVPKRPRPRQYNNQGGNAQTPATSGSWISHSFFDNGYRGWIIRVSSTVNKAIVCQGLWNGIRTGIVGNSNYGDGAIGQGGGESISGRIHFQVPAHPGRGSAIVASWRSMQGVANFSYEMDCR